MSMKQEIETWVVALQHYDSNEFEESVQAFQPIADTSKILFNCGVIRATLGEHEAAIQYYRRATALDQYLAVAYFQQGVSHFLLGEFELAYTDFNNTLLFLRGNKFINYEQLGLKYKLHSCEALFNRGLCYIYLQQAEAGMSDLTFAAKEKATLEHNVIDEAIKEHAEGYTVFSIPVGVLFRPSEAKVKNVRTRDYLGRARLVATSDEQPGMTHRRHMSADLWSKDDRPAENISFAATHLVRPGGVSSHRSRQQSEPPINRNVFPPTPPPENEKHTPVRQNGRSSSPENTVPGARASSLSRAAKPEPLELGIAAFDRSQQQHQQQPKSNHVRHAPARSASERPRDRRHDMSNGDSHYRNGSGSKEKLFGQIDYEGQQDAIGEQMARNRSSAKSNTFPRQQYHVASPSIVEEDEEDEPNAYFNNNPVRASNATLQSLRSESDRHSSYRSSGARSRKAPPVLEKIRVKVHYKDDTRFMFITLRTLLAELLDQLAKKFSIMTQFKAKIRDEEGDMITMGDQDDLDMAVAMSKDAAAKESSEVGKMELWIHDV